jgi:hypothetical protein
LNTAGGKTVATTESVVIVYNSPVVEEEVKLSGGGLKNYDAIEGYYKTFLKDGTEARVNFYKGYYNGALNITFGTESSAEPSTSDVVISLKADTTRTVGDQVFSVVKY